ncbi:MAG: GLUG motif-containing protein, partial [Candidatus Thermoplasmatota archaeon]
GTFQHDSIGVLVVDLVGQGYGSLKRSYATGDVDGGSEAVEVGGLVGRSYYGGEIKNCYATGDATGNEEVGGLVGRLGLEDVDYINNSYALGKPDGTTRVGGFLGYNRGPALVNNSYWNTETSGTTTGIGEGGDGGGDVTGLTTSDMTWQYSSNAYDGWDMSSTPGQATWWSGDHEVVEDRNGNTGYPALGWQLAYGVKVYAPADRTESSSGTYTYSYDIENTGYMNDTYDLNATASESGWSASSQQSSVTVSAGATSSVDVDVTIPDDGGGESCDVTLEAASQSNGTVSDSDFMTVTLQEDYGVTVNAPPDQTEGSSGTKTYSYDIENTGNTGDTYDLNATASQSGWSASAPADVTVGAGTTSSVNVDVDIPSDVEGESCDVTLEAVSQGNSNFSDSGAMTVTLETSDTDYVMINPESDQTITAGETIDFSAEAYDSEDNLITDDDSNFAWDAGGGSISGSGLFDETEPGDYDVTATYEGVISNSTTVTVELDADYIVIDPAEDQTIEAGEAIDFSAEAYDESDNLITDEDTDFIWENADSSGLFDETEAGEYDVSAGYGGVTSSPTTVTVEPASVDNVEISPNSTQQIDAGEIIEFSAEAFDEHGNTITDTNSDFEWEGSDGSGTFSKVELGTYSVQAHYPDPTGESSIEVTVEVSTAEEDYIEISPEESTITAGEEVSYTADVYDEYGNHIDDVTGQTSWSIDESGHGGRWEQDRDAYISNNDGTWTVRGDYEDLEDTATLTVEVGAIEYVEITPDTDFILTAGDTEDFSAEAYDAKNNLITDDDTNFTWEAEGESISESGLFDETEAGEYHVTASYEGVISNYTTLTVEPAEVEEIIIDPAEDQTIEAGESIDFSAEAYDEYDNLITDDDTDFAWENADSSGAFDKTEGGDFEVKAAYEGETSDSTTVTVETFWSNYWWLPILIVIVVVGMILVVLARKREEDEKSKSPKEAKRQRIKSGSEVSSLERRVDRGGQGAGRGGYAEKKKMMKAKNTKKAKKTIDGDEKEGPEEELEE